MKQLATLIWGIGIGVVFMACPCFAKPAIDVNRLADAIYKAEGGAKTVHPYGILTHYKNTSPRQACINTIRHAQRDWNGKGDFIAFLGTRYCPVNCSNDNGTNRFWISNVRKFYEAKRCPK